MFGSKKAAKPSPLEPVTDFDDQAIKLALTGEWLSLALARLQTNFRTGYERHDWDEPSAQGVVHFETGFDRLIRAELHINTEPREETRGRIGRAHLTSMRELGGDPGFILLRVAIADPRGKITSALQDSFNSAALSGNRFVHVHFRREEPNFEAMLTELKESGYGAYHSLTEISFKRETILPKAPVGSWSWTRQI